MVGFMDILGGAMEGAGEGLLARANRLREEAMRREEREWQLEDQRRERDWQLQDRSQDRDWQTADRREDRDWELEDEEREAGRTRDRLERDAGTLRALSDPEKTERTRHIMGRLVEAGFTPQQAAGMVGNFMQESSLETGGEWDDGGRTSGGMGSWRAERLEELKNYAREQRKDWSDLDTQIDFFLFEGETTEKDAFAKIREAETAEEAAIIGSQEYWRPGEPHNDRRAAYAREAEAIWNASETGFETVVDPETPSEVRGAAARGLGLDIEDEDEGDWSIKEVDPPSDADFPPGTYVLARVNDQTDEVIYLKNADGDYVTETQRSRADDDDDDEEVEISDHTLSRIQSKTTDPAIRSDMTDVILAGMEAGLSERKARAAAEEFAEEDDEGYYVAFDYEGAMSAVTGGTTPPARSGSGPSAEEPEEDTAMVLDEARGVMARVDRLPDGPEKEAMRQRVLAELRKYGLSEADL